MTTGAPPAAGTQGRSRWIALVVLCVGMLMIVLDTTIVNVALPAIQDDLGFSQAGLAWVINGYLITFGGLLLLSGRLGDLLGRRRVFLWGLLLFTLASALCGAAQSQAVLVVARLLQGVGAALGSSVLLGMIVMMFPDPRERAKALGVFSFVSSAGGSIGLLAGGVLTSAISWHWIFFVNVPIGLAMLAIAPRVIVRDEGLGLGRGADVAGATLITSSLMLGVYTIIKVPEHGWLSAHTLLLGIVSVALMVGFVLRQAHAANPLMPLRVLRSRNVAGANVVQVLMAAAMFSVFFFGPLYLDRVLGLSAIEIGLCFLPTPVVGGACSLFAYEPLATRFGARATLAAGLTLIVAGLLLLTGLSADGSYASDVLPSMVLFGGGLGVAWPALLALAMSGATAGDSGLASGLVNTAQQVGGALGLSVLATLADTRTETLLRDGASAATALSESYALAFGVGVGFVAVAVAVALVVLRTTRRAPAPAEDAEPAPVAAEA